MTKKDISSAMAECLRIYLYTPGLVNEVYDGRPRATGNKTWNEATFNDTAALMVQCMEESNAE